MFLIDTITASHYITQLRICYQIVHPKNSYKHRKRKLSFISISFKHKEFKNQKFLSNILTFYLTFSYSIKYRFFSRKKKRDKVIKNYLQSLSLQCPYYFPHISEFRHIAVACLTLKVNLCLAPTGGYERKLKWSIFAVHLSHKVSNKIMLYRTDFQLNLHYLLTHILIYICILAKSRIIKVWLNSHV